MAFAFRPIALVLIAVLVTGCSRGVHIQPAWWDARENVEPGSYRIRLHGRVEYLVRSYAMTDSTVVIQELLPADERFTHGREQLPIEIALERVSSIERLKANVGVTVGMVIWMTVIVALVIWLANTNLAIGN